MTTVYLALGRRPLYASRSDARCSIPARSTVPLYGVFGRSTCQAITQYCFLFCTLFPTRSDDTEAHLPEVPSSKAVDCIASLPQDSIISACGGPDFVTVRTGVHYTVRDLMYPGLSVLFWHQYLSVTGYLIPTLHVGPRPYGTRVT